MIKFHKTPTSNAELSQVQENLIRTLNPIFNLAILNGVELKNITLVSGDNVIDHKLGRVLLGWLITRKRANANIYDKQDNNATPSLNLLLNSSAGVEVDIYVY